MSDNVNTNGADTAVAKALIAELGEGQVMLDADVHARAAGIRRKGGIRANVLVRPRDTNDVSAALKICNEHNASVIAHGGLSGLVRSADTEAEDVVISLERLNKIEAINPLERTAVVGSGVVLQTLQEAVEEQGLMFPLDIGGRGSCTIGGNIATNAGGNRVIRYGMTRDMILGLEAVLPDGTIVSSMNQMIKNNSGYDLKQLFIGSEGTLGIVTRAVVRCQPQTETQPTVLVAVESFANLMNFLDHMHSGLRGNLSAFELMWNNFYKLVSTPPAKNPPPLPQTYPYYVLVEAMGAEHSLVENVLADALEKELIADAVLAGSEAQRHQLWALRDDTEQFQQHAPNFVFDVSLRLPFMEDYVEEVNRRLGEAFDEFKNFTLGHMGDGNLHFIVAVGDGGKEARSAVERSVYEPLAEIAGSVSAEHGIGLEKKPYLEISRSDSEINLMRTIKKALDPKGLLNPGKIFDL